MAVAILVVAGALVRSVSGIDRWDLDVVRDVADRRTDLGATLTKWGTHLAETVPVAVLTLLLALVAWRYWRSLAAPVFVAVAVGGEKLIYLVSSIIVGRDRPSVETLGETYATRSFPSGHVASAVTLYGAAALLLGLAAGRRWRNLAFVIAAVFAVVVAVCRVYRGFHFTTDVVAGAALGAGWLAWTWRRFEPELRTTSGGDAAARPDAAETTSGVAPLAADRATARR